MTSVWSHAARSPQTTSVARRAMRPTVKSYAARSQALAGESNNDELLDGTWDFVLANSMDAAEQIRSNPESVTWDRISVPSSWVLAGRAEWGTPQYTNVQMPWEANPPEVPRVNPCGVYRTHFDDDGSAARLIVEIGSAESFVSVWCNEVFVGASTDSRLAAQFDLGPARSNGVNELVLIVAQWSASSWLEDQDQWWLPGLHRSVRLIRRADVCLDNVSLIPGLDLADEAGILDCVVGVEFASAPVAGYCVSIEVLDSNGMSLITADALEVPIFELGDPLGELLSGMTFEGNQVRTQLRVEGVDAWNHETPHLYQVLVILYDPDGTELEVCSIRTGFRSIQIANRQLLINGQPVQIAGVNRHEFDPDHGRVVSRESMRADVEMMKRYNVNAVRCAHYPADPFFYELCDEYGLYVIDEANIETHARQVELCSDQRYLAAWLERGARMVQRDVNHPSIVAWSLGNESGYGPSHDALAAWIRRVDPTRPLHYEGAIMHDLYASSPVSDIVAPMYRSPQELVEWSQRNEDTRRPLILCEYNHAMGNAGGLETYDEVFENTPGVQGGFIWEWRDHGLRRGDGTIAYGGDFAEQRHDGNFCCDGLVGPDREPHPLLEHFSSLNEPIRIRAGDNNFTVQNRRWFSTLDDIALEAIWCRNGIEVQRFALSMEDVAPRSSRSFEWPDGPEDVDAFETLDVIGRCVRPWPGVKVDDVVVHQQLVRRSQTRVSPDEPQVAGHLPNGLAVPEATLWRAPTDNDGIQTGWMAGVGERGRWLMLGLHELISSSVEQRGDDTQMERVTIWTNPSDTVKISHIHRRRRNDDQSVSCEDIVELPAELDDIPRVGVRFELPLEFSTIQWFGRGPGDSYPDRVTATFGRWHCDAFSQECPFVMPQEFGHHQDTHWVRFATRQDGSDPASAQWLTISADQPFGWTALGWTSQQLTEALHREELGAPQRLVVTLDIAHRGLGTGACGPDTAERFRLRAGSYRLAWRIHGSMLTQGTMENSQ